MDQNRFALERPIEVIGHIASHLLHPLAIRLGSDPDNLNPASLQVDYEQGEIASKPEVVPDFDGEEVSCGQ